jgi:hypothetical protein
VLLNRAAWWEKAVPASSSTASSMAEETAAKEEPMTATTTEMPPETPPVDRPQPVIPLAAEPQVEVHGDEITLWRSDRRYRVRGLGNNTSYDVMKVNVLLARQEDFHVDTFDMQLDRQRTMFIKRAAEELRVNEDVIRKDIGALFLALEQRHAEAILKALQPEKPEIVMTDPERAEALALLKDPKLLDRVLIDFERCGLVGEETNKLLAYIAAVSRHLESPLAVVVQSSSASGKSSLMDAVLAFVPEEERIQFSAMTGQSLYYMTGNGSEAQDPGCRGRGGRQPRLLRAEAATERRFALDRIHRQGRGDRQARHARVSRGRSRDDLHDHHGDGCRRRTAQPLLRIVGE